MSRAVGCSLLDEAAQIPAWLSKARSRHHVVCLVMRPRLSIAVEVPAGDIRKAGIGDQPNRVLHPLLQSSVRADGVGCRLLLWGLSRPEAGHDQEVPGDPHPCRTRGA